MRKWIYGAGQDAVDDETSLVPTGNVMLREEPAASGEIKSPGGVMARGWGEWVVWAAGTAAPPHPAPTPSALTWPFAPQQVPFRAFLSQAPRILSVYRQHQLLSPLMCLWEKPHATAPFPGFLLLGAGSKFSCRLLALGCTKPSLTLQFPVHVSDLGRPPSCLWGLQNSRQEGDVSKVRWFW